MRKSALTAYGRIGTDWVRMTAARLDEGYAFVRADGSNSIVPMLPETFRTSGDIVNVAAQLGHRTNVAAVPNVGLKNHVWKTELSLAEVCIKFGVPELEQALIAAYASEAEAAA